MSPARGGALAALALGMLAAAASAQALRHPGDKAPAPPPPPPTATHAAAFPSLEPFRQSPFWGRTVEHLRRSGLSDDALTTLDQELGVIRMQNELDARTAREAGDAPAAGSAAGAPRLGDQVGEDRRLWLWQVPIVLDQTLPLWNAAEWDQAQLEQAGAVARFFAQQEGPPKLVFAAGRQAENQLQLERLVAWFRAEAARPESYALMLVRDDDGPYAPVEAEAARSLPELGSQDLDAERRLALRRDEKAGGPWLLQLLKGKKPLWTIALTRVPAGAELRLAGAPAPLGERGWVARLDFGRSLDLYLDAQGRPLFYFTAW